MPDAEYLLCIESGPRSVSQLLSLTDENIIQISIYCSACAQVYRVPDDESEDGDTTQPTAAADDDNNEQTASVSEPDMADNCQGLTFVLTGPSDSDSLLTASDGVDDSISHIDKADVNSFGS